MQKIIMMKSHPSGFHTTLTPELHTKIIEAVRSVLVMSHAAALAGIPKQTLFGWLKRGKNDMIEGNNTIFAQLTDAYNKARAEFVQESIIILRTCPRNYQSLTWLLEKCFREDFGPDSDEMRELKDLFKVILPLLGKGDALNGKVDIEETESATGCGTGN